MGAAEGKFKEGDWVRATHTDYPEDIGVGEAFKVGARYGHGVEPEGEHSNLFFCNWELEPWTPKVGERVRCIQGTAIVDVGKEYTVVTGWYAPAGGNTFFVDTGEHGALDYSADYFEPVTEPLPVAAEAQPAETDGGYDAWFSEKVKEAMDDTRTSIPHDEAMASIKARLSKSTPPAPLTIQAGKFYKTRDGRKVGPMISYRDSIGDGLMRFIEEHGDGRGWSACGVGMNRAHGEDLIAEWPSDTTTNTAATVDALDEEYGPVAAVADVPVAKPPMIRTRNGYGFELARAGAYVWVDIGQKAPITVRADSIKTA